MTDQVVALDLGEMIAVERPETRIEILPNAAAAARKFDGGEASVMFFSTGILGHMRRPEAQRFLAAAARAGVLVRVGGAEPPRGVDLPPMLHLDLPFTQGSVAGIVSNLFVR